MAPTVRPPRRWGAWIASWIAGAACLALFVRASTHLSGRDTALPGTQAGIVADEAVTDPRFVNGLFVDRAGGRLVASTEGGVMVWPLAGGAGELWTARSGLCGNSVLRTVDVSGELWFGTRSGGVCMRDGAGRWDREARLDYPVPAEYWVTALAIDGADRLWAGTMIGDVWQHDGDSGWRLIVEGETNGESDVDAMTAGADGSMIVALQDGRVFNVGRNGSDSPEWLLPSRSEGYTDHQELAVDRDGRLWHSNGWDLRVWARDGSMQTVRTEAAMDGVMGTLSGGDIVTCGAVERILRCFIIDDDLRPRQLVAANVAEDLKVTAVAGIGDDRIAIGTFGQGVLTIREGEDVLSADAYPIEGGHAPGYYFRALGVSPSGTVATAYEYQAGEEEWLTHLFMRAAGGSWVEHIAPASLSYGREGVGTREVLTPDHVGVDSTGVVWITRGWDALRFDGVRWQRILQPNGDWLDGSGGIAIDGDDNVGMATGSGLWYIRHGETGGRSIQADQPCANGTGSVSGIASVAVSPDATWVVSSGCGVWITDPTLARLVPLPVRDTSCARLHEGEISEVAARTDDVWWMSVYDFDETPMIVRIVRFDRSSGTCRDVSQSASGEAIGLVYELEADSDGGVWSLLNVGGDDAPAAAGRLVHFSVDGTVHSLPTLAGFGGHDAMDLVWDGSSQALWAVLTSGGLMRFRDGREHALLLPFGADGASMR